MRNKKLGNFVKGKVRLYQKVLQTPKVYDSMHQFLVDYPMPDGFDREYSCEFYCALRDKVLDADLPLPQRAIRSNLLVQVGIQSGIINMNKGANL